MKVSEIKSIIDSYMNPVIEVSQATIARKSKRYNDEIFGY